MPEITELTPEELAKSLRFHALKIDDSLIPGLEKHQHPHWPPLRAAINEIIKRVLETNNA